MASRLPGPLSLMSIGSHIDPGTASRQRNSSPGHVSGRGTTSYSIAGPVLVGKSAREPGKNKDGSQYEDMFFADSPPQSRELLGDPLFILPDAKLEELGRDLMNSVSTGDLNTVALECWDRFCKGTGGTFTSKILDAEVRANEATREFVKDFAESFGEVLVARECDLERFLPIGMDCYTFSSLMDKATGLGIIVHDWWSIKAEVTNYTATWDEVAKVGAFYGNLVFTMTDDFALDWNDIVLHGNDRIPPTLGFFHTGDRFKAWYILQHWRNNHRPFFVQSKQEYSFDDGAPRPF